MRTAHQIPSAADSRPKKQFVAKSKKRHRPNFDPSQFDHIVTRCRIYGHEIFANVRQKLGRQHVAGRHQRYDLGNIGRSKEDKMDQIETSAVIWGFFMAASMKAAAHLGKI